LAKKNKTFLISGIVLVNGVVSVRAKDANAAIKKATAGKFDEIAQWDLKRPGFSWDGTDVETAEED
jgi:hypothetical protein